MRIQRRRVAGTLAAAILLLLALAGCRAFEPETVIVNKAPETYLTGAPVEEGGGQFHFHLFWHGTDEDGRVERFVWALTDSTVQDLETDDDEEDERFNPAENITTLEIGHWTTQTDTVIDFQINEGSIQSRDMTFHIVAVDDRGDFDRTPARLYFLSNALGQPRLRFYGSLDQTDETVFADFDTIGYGQPFVLSWNGSTPNIASFTDELLAARDTVPPLDGLYGYKYRLPTDVDCDAVNEDCWLPRRFNPAQGRQVSYFGGVTSLEFANNGVEGSAVAEERLAQGVHVLLVNTVDVAGVQVPSDKQALNFVINYDPETYLLGQPQAHDVNHDGSVDAGEFLDFAQDPFFTDDALAYPYWTAKLPDGTYARQNFGPGDRVPMRSFVTFKAVGWDDHRDVRLRDIDNLPAEGLTPREVEFQGKFDAVGFYRGGANSLFRFESQFSPTRNGWVDETRGVAADTISFPVGSFNYEFTMRSVDELEKRDFTPSVFDFYGNFAPEVECVRVVESGTPSIIYDGTCDTAVDTFYVRSSSAVDVSATHPDWIPLDQVRFGSAYVNPTANSVLFTDPGNSNYIPVLGYFFEYDLQIYAEDSEYERLFQPRTIPGGPTVGNPAERMLSCRYQITSQADALSNLIREGGGEDDLSVNTYTLTGAGSAHAGTYDDNGVWTMTVTLFAPLQILLQGTEAFVQALMGTPYFLSETVAQRAADLLTLQYGPTTAQVAARDGTKEDYVAERCAYYFWDDVRVHDLDEPFVGEDWWDKIDNLCTNTLNTGFAGRLLEDDFCFQSPTFSREYVLMLVTNTPEIYPPLP
ncbi:MAG TPA: hypothetical protein P5571_07095 [Candidatus Krumholzibacteria bacterium]|nr:hypothetical protein [Candidatus Krumholzibacteria bacterium]HRX51111.1 hypothetical protein [Candidatus Krumholzibacteria bacterium]